VGAVSSTVEVSSAAALLQTEAPVRGGSISSIAATNLPITNQNPVSLVLTLPGVSSNRYSFGVGTFPVNGARARSNNFLIDGTENNDISITGQAFQITNPDAVQEVSAQTSNFDSEYGRAGGGVINVITKSGTNGYHGTLRYYLDSTFTDALTNLNKQDPNQVLRGHPSPGTDQFFAGTFGGPVIRNKTFFFSAYQEERQISTSVTQLYSPTAIGRAALLAAYPNNPRVALLNQITAGADATVAPFYVNGPIAGQRFQFGQYNQAYGNKNSDRQLLERVDHSFSNSDQLAVRYLYDSSTNPTGGTVGFNGFFTSQQNQVNSALLTETHTFSPTLTNEFHLGYNRIFYFFPFDATSPLAGNIPTITISGFGTGSFVGVASNLPQGRIANNYELQDTLNRVLGKHSLRIGTSLLNQRSKQAAPFNSRGTLSYQASNGYSGLANYIDDYGGSGSTARDFGSASYYPKLFRQAYFAQDRWRAMDDLTVSLGVRYEYFGEPINSLRTPAYTGLFNIDPVAFTGPYSQPNSVKPDKNNFSPSVGLAYAPGDKKTVYRAGFSMGYDSFFNNIASNAVASAPNNISTQITSTPTTASPRGLANLGQNLPSGGVFTALNSQNLVYQNLVNPYYLHYSIGAQRELPGKFVLDVSYVGTRGVKLFATEDLNPIVPASLEQFPAGYSAANLPRNRYTNRIDPLQGARNIRTNGANSNYNSAQFALNRRFAENFIFSLSYTRSKYIDNASDIFSTSNNNNNNQTASAVVPTIFGGLTKDRAVSTYDRPNRVVVTSVYELPFLRSQKSWLGHILGGWELSGIYTMESGAPLNILNGVDADGIGGNLIYDRPNYNPNGIPNTRAVPSGTGYINQDTQQPIDPATAMYIGLAACTATTPCPTGALGRNTYRTPILNDLDANLTKSVRITESMHLEFRGEFYNVFNHRQYGVASASVFDYNSTPNLTIGGNVTNTPAGHFLAPGFADGGARVLKYQVKFVF